MQALQGEATVLLTLLEAVLDQPLSIFCKTSDLPDVLSLRTFKRKQWFNSNLIQ